MNTELRKKFEEERNGLGEDPQVQWDLVKQTLSAPLSFQAWSTSRRRHPKYCHHVRCNGPLVRYCKAIKNGQSFSFEALLVDYNSRNLQDYLSFSFSKTSMYLK